MQAAGEPFDASLAAASLAQEERAYRDARIQSAMLIVAVGMLCFVALHGVLGRPLLQSIMAVMVLGVLVGRAWSRRPPRGAAEALPVHLAITCATAAVISSSILLAEGNPVLPYYLVLVPAFAACLLSVGATFCWTLAAIGGFALIRASSGWLTLPLEAPAGPQEVAFDQTVLVLMVFGAAYSQWQTTSRHVAGMRAREAMLSAQARELAAARDAALRASGVKSEFLATVSHEIRTPMNAVIGLTELLSETKLDEEQRGMLETVRRSGEALLVMLSDVLDFSKIESDRIELEHQPFSLRTCIEDAMELLASRAAERNVELLYDHPAEIAGWIFGDPMRVRQVVVNLLSNAVKFTAAGDVIVRVLEAPSEGGKPMLRICVRDTGIGIPPDRRDRLFQPFSQVDASTTRRYGGTGLGLVISKRLVGLMGGSLTVESEPGRGSEFSFTLPAVAAPSEPEQLRFDPHVLHGRRVLLAHPHPLQRDLLVRDATARGVALHATGLLPEALGWLRTGECCDALIVDSRLLGAGDVATLRVLCKEIEASILLLVSPGEAPAAGLAPGDEGLVTARISRPLRAKRLAELLAELWKVPGLAAEPAPPHSVARLALRVLVAEDNVVNQQVILRLLQRLGCDADLVADGVQAVEAARRSPYDLILMDVQMPEMDGLAATRAIRSLGAHGSRPTIVALTANALADDRTRCLESGMDDFLAKPISRQALAAVLERCVEQSAALAAGGCCPLGAGGCCPLAAGGCCPLAAGVTLS